MYQRGNSNREDQIKNLFKNRTFFFALCLMVNMHSLRAMNRQTECSICLVSLLEGRGQGATVSIRQQCGHAYHTPCILRAVDMNARCPECRGDIVLDPSDENGLARFSIPVFRRMRLRAQPPRRRNEAPAPEQAREPDLAPVERAAAIDAWIAAAERNAAERNAAIAAAERNAADRAAAARAAAAERNAARDAAWRSTIAERDETWRTTIAAAEEAARAERSAAWRTTIAERDEAWRTEIAAAEEAARAERNAAWKAAIAERDAKRDAEVRCTCTLF